jgi:glycerol-3-phosphate dehydrogenase
MVTAFENISTHTEIGTELLLGRIFNEIGFNKIESPIFRDLVKGTCIHLDYSTDLRGVEMLSILKNVYAIALGIVDAQYDSPNLRFLFLTKAFSEIRAILIKFDGRKKTLFK